MDVKAACKDAILEWIAEFEDAGFHLVSESEDRIEIAHERGGVIATWNGSAWELSGENAAARDALAKVVARAIDRASPEDARLAKKNGNGHGNGGTNTKSIAVQPPMSEPQELTLETIKKYLCPEATDQEAYIFLQLCRHRNLNPFLNQAYLVKLSPDLPAQMIVSKEAFVLKAEHNPAFDGFRAGIIVQSASGELERREGCFLRPDETLLGGWAEVFRKDRKLPFRSEVALKEYYKDHPKSPWRRMPATMIRKVALVQALREAFPSDLGGLYDEAEVAV